MLLSKNPKDLNIFLNSTYTLEKRIERKKYNNICKYDPISFGDRESLGSHHTKLQPTGGAVKLGKHILKMCCDVYIEDFNPHSAVTGKQLYLAETHLK